MRDSLLGREHKDQDYLIMASPEQIKQAVEGTGHVADELKVRDRVVGIRAYGPELPAEGVELAPPRIEVSTGPGRHDFEIVPHPAVGPPNTMFHVASRSARASIETEGLRGRREGTYLWATPDQAQRWSEGDPEPEDVWAVDIVGLGVKPSGSGLEGAHWVDAAIGPRRLSRAPGGEGVIRADPLAADAQRRDFTANALYRDTETGEVVDPTGQGKADLEKRLLRTTSPDSFRDDPLRILRALRFQSQLGFELAPETREQMHEHADAVRSLTTSKGGVSGTAQVELDKLLMGDHVGDALRTMRDTGVLSAFLPELAPIVNYDQESRYHGLPLDEHVFSAIETAAQMKAPLEVRLALLFHDSGKPGMTWRGEDGHLHYYANPALGKPDHAEVGADLAREALTRLNYPDRVKRDVVRLIERHMLQPTRKDKKVRELRAEMGDDLLDKLLIHRVADASAKGEDDDGRRSDFMEKFTEFKARIQASRDAGDPLQIRDLAIDGTDLLALGLEGPQIGEALRYLRDLVLANPQKNDPEWLLEQARRWLARNRG